MRIKSSKGESEKLRCQLGQHRIVRKFLWWPRQFFTTDNRVFEYANILEEVQITKYKKSGMVYNCEPECIKWVEISFIDEEKEAATIMEGPDVTWLAPHAGYLPEIPENSTGIFISTDNNISNGKNRYVRI